MYVHQLTSYFTEHLVSRLFVVCQSKISIPKYIVLLKVRENVSLCVSMECFKNNKLPRTKNLEEVFFFIFIQVDIFIY